MLEALPLGRLEVGCWAEIGIRWVRAIYQAEVGARLHVDGGQIGFRTGRVR